MDSNDSASRRARTWKQVANANPQHAYLLTALRAVKVAERLTRFRRHRLHRLVSEAFEKQR